LRLAALFAHVAMRPALSHLLFSLARLWPSLLTWGARLGGKAHCAADAAHIDAVLRTPLRTPSRTPSTPRSTLLNPPAALRFNPD
jgi:hypothetical protein